MKHNLNIMERNLKYLIIKRHFFANKVCVGNSASPKSLVDEGTFPSQKIWLWIITKPYVISEGMFSMHHYKSALDLLVLEYSAIQLIPVLRSLCILQYSNAANILNTRLPQNWSF